MHIHLTHPHPHLRDTDSPINGGRVLKIAKWSSSAGPRPTREFPALRGARHPASMTIPAKEKEKEDERTKDVVEKKGETSRD